jgi:eukaryotic-like serine/threonine-protein kinase
VTVSETPADRTVGHYRLLEPVGAGGMGEVFRARDTRLGRTVALKMLPPHIAADPDRRERFMQEARATASLSHPGIAVLFEAGEADGQLYLAFEFVPGETLGSVIAAGPIPARRAVPIALQIADALAEAHAAGIVHRDIKPDNVVITPKGGAKVLDFGLASWTEGGLARTIAPTQLETAPSLVVGTIAYMSPEQALAQALDARSDVFSLGVVLYEMLTGRNPFLAPTAAATLVNILQLRVPAPSSLNPQVPPELDAIVARALTRDLQGRYGSAAALAADLRQAFGDRTEHILDADADFPGSASRRPRRGLMRGAVLALLLIGAIGATAAIAYPRRGEIARWWKHAFGPAPDPVVAVIPLEEIGEREHWFADGLTDDVIMRLGQTPGLRVLGRSSTRSYRGRAPSDVAGELGASVVLTGSVQRVAGDIKINLELIDPSDGVQIWRQQFVRAAAGVLALQSEIADAVASALRLQLVGSPARARTAARTVNPEAYETYVRGRAAFSRRDQQRAIALFEEAIAKDPGLAEAHAALATARYHLATFAGHGLNQAEETQIRAAAQRAAAIEPDLPEVEIALGLTEPTLRAALSRLVRAATLDPSNADAYHDIGDQIAGVAPEQALAMFNRSRALDPQLFANYPDGVVVNLQLGRVDAAGEIAREALRLFPDNPYAPTLGASIAGFRGEADRAIGLLRKLADRAVLPSPGWLNIARLEHAAGRPAAAVRTLRQAVERYPQDCELRGALAGLLADTRQAAEARTLAASITPASPIACQATVAAAMGDAGRTASALRRIAGQEPELRSWLLLQFGVSRAESFDQRAYPWGKVADAPAVVDAQRQLHAARDQLRIVAEEELRALSTD